MTPKALIKAALNGKCVTGFHVSGNDRMPAAFVASMQFSTVVARLHHMKVYKPKTKSKTPWRNH